MVFSRPRHVTQPPARSRVSRLAALPSSRRRRSIAWWLTRNGTPPKIDLACDIYRNGILTATARDTTTGKEQSITISGSTQLSKEEIDRMVADAQRHAAEDRPGLRHLPQWYSHGHGT